MSARVPPAFRHLPASREASHTPRQGVSPPALWGPLPYQGSTELPGEQAAACTPALDRWFPTQRQSPTRPPPAQLICQWTVGHHRSCPGVGTSHPAVGPSACGDGGLRLQTGRGEGGWGRELGGGILTHSSAWGCPGRRRQRRAAAPTWRWCWGREGLSTHTGDPESPS